MADQHALELVQEDHPDRFNALVDGKGGQVDLSSAHLRSYDLRKFHLTHANLCGAYLRASDLRGLDLSHAKLHGASLKDAKVSGVMFPANLSAEEIALSLAHGTRLRHLD